MRFSTVVWVLLGCFAILVAVIVGSIKTLGSARQYEEMLKTYVLETLGRELVVNGSFEIRSDLPPKLIVTDVVLRNTSALSRLEMVRIGHLEAEADLGALFLHTLKIRRIEATDVDLLMGKKEAGDANWDLSASSDLAPKEKERLDLPPFPGFSTLRNITIKRMRLIWRDDRFGNDRITFNDVFLTLPGDVGPVTIVARGLYDDMPFGLSGTAGGVRAVGSLLTGDERYPLRLRWQGRKTTAVVDGTIETDKAGDARLSLRLNMNGNDFPGVRWKKELSFPGPFSLSGNLEISSDRWEIHNTNIVMGMPDADMLQFRGKIMSLFPFREPEGRLSIRLASLRGLSTWAGIDFPPVGGVKAGVLVRKTKDGKTHFVVENGSFGSDSFTADLVADFNESAVRGRVALPRLDVGAWSDGWGGVRKENGSSDHFPGDIELDITAEEMIYRNLVARDGSMRVRIAGKEIAVRPLSLGVAEGRFEGWFLWDQMDNASLWLEGHDLNAGKILNDLDLSKAPLFGTARLSASLYAHGKDLSSLRSSIGGKIWFLAEKGRIPRLDAVQPLFPSETSFKCVASLAEVKDGVVNRMALMLDGQEMMLAGQGKIDFSKDGKADLIFIVREKGQMKRASRVVGLKGSIRSPDFVPLPHAPVAVPVLPIAEHGDFSPCLMAVAQKRSSESIPSVFKETPSGEKTRGKE